MIWRKSKFWLSLVGAATLIGLLEGAQVYAGQAALQDPYTWWESLSSTMPSWYLMVAILPGVLFVATKFPLDSGKWPIALVVHLLAAVLFTAIHITGSSWISQALDPSIDASYSFRRQIATMFSLYFVVELVTYFAIVGAHHAYVSTHRYRERERQTAALALNASKLEASLWRANLDSLRTQLNPHFLFNTLNAISVMAMKGERQGVVRMLTRLSDLLRLSLEHKEQLVSLREELEFLDIYLEIEHVRFKDRLTLERDVDSDALDAEVPSLLLQPLVENAIRHGISQRPGPGTVRVEAAIVDGDALEIRVLDTGPGFGNESRTRGGTGVGLANTRARLEQLYGTRQTMELCNRAEGGACVTVRLPLRIYSGVLVDEPLRTTA
jgi:two-component system, LytTR family, sensor kinase